MPVVSAPISAELDNIEDTRDAGYLLARYAPLIKQELHCALANWLGRNSVTQDGGFDAGLSQGLKNIHVRGNSLLRQAASGSLSNLQFLDRFHSGDGGVCRIWRGASIKLDDCTCRQVGIVSLHFAAADFGDSIYLDDPIQREVVSAEMEGRNQCALISLAAGLIAAPNRANTSPARSRVMQTARVLRLSEWKVDTPFADSIGASKSLREKTMIILRRDIAQANHDVELPEFKGFLTAFVAGNFDAPHSHFRRPPFRKWRHCVTDKHSWGARTGATEWIY